MDYRKIIKEIGRGKNHARDLDFDTARGLYARMLDGDVPDLELGSILIALRIKGGNARFLRGNAATRDASDAAGGETHADRHSYL